jgi:hypothetical protein|tara:strand:- start:3415 stop:3918 length:504 start_codon:yes stop_codon:yes gene_type:complete
MNEKQVLASLEWWPRNEPHGHKIVFDTRDMSGEDIEEYALELAEAVGRCSPSRHNGHGTFHSADDMQEAYDTAIKQALTRDFGSEERERQWKEYTYHKWGGHMPAAVIYFDQDGKEQMLVPDKQGNPVQYDLNGSVLSDIIPSPKEAGARPDDQGIGWRVDRRKKHA